MKDFYKGELSLIYPMDFNLLSQNVVASVLYLGMANEISNLPYGQKKLQTPGQACR